jgi:hypothetical protein
LSQLRQVGKRGENLRTYLDSVLSNVSRNLVEVLVNEILDIGHLVEERRSGLR